jgi:hypothetical protein
MYKPGVELGFFFALAPPGKYNSILIIFRYEKNVCSYTNSLKQAHMHSRLKRVGWVDNKTFALVTLSL